MTISKRQFNTMAISMALIQIAGCSGGGGDAAPTGSGATPSPAPTPTDPVPAPSPPPTPTDPVPAPSPSPTPTDPVPAPNPTPPPPGGGGGGTTAPIILIQPQSKSVASGETAEFFVSATGSLPLFFRWYLNDTQIPGAINPTYRTLPLSPPDSGARYRVEVINAVGRAVSQDAVVLVDSDAPGISGQPQSIAVVAGQTANFSVTATGRAPLTYEWSRNGTVLPGAASALYSVVAQLGDDGAKFKVKVSNTLGSVTSSEAELKVFATAIAPTILSQPTDVTVIEGEEATFRVVISGTGPFDLQWILNGVDMSLGGRVVGVYSTILTYTIPLTKLSESGGKFSLRISNAAGSVTSEQALLTVLPRP